MINAVIFDLDGTVLDNEADWEKAFRQVAEKHNVGTPALLQPGGWWHEPGLGLSPNWKRTISDTAKAEIYARDTWVTYHRNFKEGMGELKLRDGVTEMIDKIKERGWRTGLCTGSSWNVVEPELEQLQMYRAFDVTTTGEEVMLLKPDPEIYVLTAQKLETDPESCVVIEDAVAGVRAAVEAGCQVIGLASIYAPQKLLMDAGAHFVINNINDIEGLLKHYEQLK